MLVLNLCCAQSHHFEGWFGSNDDFKSQQDRGLLSCPMCGDETITRLPSAPRLNVSHLRGERDGRSAREEGQPAAALSGSPTDMALVEAAPDPSQGDAAPPASQQQPSPVLLEQQAHWLRAVAHVIKHSEDVGQQFAEEARRIHYGEAPQRAIRGSASADDTAALLDEGIEVLPLPLPAALKGPIQ